MIAHFPQNFTQSKVNSQFELNNSKLEFNKNQQQLICRICLANESSRSINQIQSDNQIIAPCQCKGSLKWVHQKCLKQWIQRKPPSSQGKFTQSVGCQICKSKIYFTTFTRPSMKSYEQVVEVLKKQLVYLVIFAFIIILVLVSIILLGSNILNQYSEQQQKQRQGIPKIAFTIVIVVLTLFFLISSACLLSYIFLKVNIKFLNKEEVTVHNLPQKISQIYPQLRSKRKSEV